MNTKCISQTYKVLDEIEHIRLRTGMYAGSTSIQDGEEYIFDLSTRKMIKKKISFIPAFIKIFSEILDNAIDESKRAPDVLDTIKIYISRDSGEISIQDNGRGIPVVLHPDTNTYIPETVFSNLRAGSNFDDEVDQSLIGTNGVGSTITNVLSSTFKIDTCDGKKHFTQIFSNGMRDKLPPNIKTGTNKHTKITFIPDYAFFKLNGLDEDHYIKMIKKIIDAAGNNSKIKFYINDEKFHFKSFAEYVALYCDAVVADETSDWKISIAPSDNGFEQISFVNSVETYNGGTHVNYVWFQVANKLREYINKKHKIDVVPSAIQAHVKMFISCNINRPKFSSQTKDNMISPTNEYKTAWEPSDKFIKRVIDAGVVDRVLLWAEAKAKAEEMRMLRELSKDIDKGNPRRVDKFSDAMEDNDRHLCELYLTEGDSARLTIQDARGKNNYIGSFALKGKPLNVMDVDMKRVIGGKDKEDNGNNEIKSILKITGLKIGVKVKSVKDLRFGKIVILSDADLDGFHIRGLLINFFGYFWPELFELGIIYFMNTPLVIATTKNKEQEFFTDESYEEWAKTAPKHDVSRFKGLGKFKTARFKKILENRENYLVRVCKLETDDIESINMAFKGNRADDRKNWLTDVNYFNNFE
jgi:DNA topoisomerase II